MKAIMLILLLAMSFNTVGQKMVDTAKKYEKGTLQYHQQKAKRHKQTGFILAGVGTGVALIGVVKALSEADYSLSSANQSKGVSVGEVITFTGGLMMSASVPYFISSLIHNKKAKMLLRKQDVSITPHMQIPQVSAGISFQF